MKKLILLLTAVVCFTACSWEYCDRCGNYKDYCTCNRYNNTYNGDRFTANTLIGVWQMDYNQGYEYGIGITLKQIEFFDGYTCDVTYSVGKDPDWWTDTFSYTYTSGYIKFNKGRTTFSFKFRGFLFPELYLQDSFGNYTWRKVR